MRFALLPTRVRGLVVAVALTAGVGAESRAIEMFTYFGDGSRVGLPSLEVPIEAYPGIPLRSDRLRARRRAMRSGYAPQQSAPRGPSQTITIRAMPEGIEAPAARPAPRSQPRSKPAAKAVKEVPVAPEPEDISPSADE